MKKNVLVALFFSILIFFFNTTCYQEVPHIVTLHYALEGDIYDISGEKHYSGEIQFTVYPSQTLFDITNGKDPSTWNWNRVSNEKKWLKTQYGDYGFTTKNGDETSEPLIFSCPWTNEIEFIVDNVQNTQTIGLYDEIYDVKDLYVNYSGPNDTIEVEFLFYRNNYSGAQTADNLIEQEEVKIVKKYLVGSPILDTPYTIIDDNNSWPASKPVTEYSRDRFNSNILNDFGYLTYEGPDAEVKNGFYCSFVDNACVDGKSFTTPSGKYTFVITDDEMNPEKYRKLELVSNDAGYPLPFLPRGVKKIQVTPKYEEPTAEVTYFYYNKERTDARPGLSKWKEKYRIGEKLRSPEELAKKYQNIWSPINNTERIVNYGYKDKTVKESGTHPDYNFRAVKALDPYYIFDETDDVGVTLVGKEHSIYSTDRVLRDMNIKPFYNKDGLITLIFNYNLNNNFSSFDRLSSSCAVNAKPDFSFNFEFGKSDDPEPYKNVLSAWLENEPYGQYGVGYGYREYNANDSTSKGTLYYFKPVTTGGSDYTFLYYDVDDTTGKLNDTASEICFGDRIDLQHFVASGIDYVIFTPKYATKEVEVTFKHQLTVKSGDDYGESDELVGKVKVIQGEKFKYSDDEIKDWIWLTGTGLNPWDVDDDVENYGYVEAKAEDGQTKKVESWYDFDRTKEFDDAENTYKFEIVSGTGAEVGSIWDSNGYILPPDLVLIPVYTVSTTEITLVYFVTSGNSSGNKSNYNANIIQRVAYIPRGQFDINPSRFGDPSYPWYNSELGDWPIDSDDYAHSLSRGNGDEYNLDFRNELQYGYRDPNDFSRRWYFGDDLNYAEYVEDTAGNIKPYKAYRYICIDESGENAGKEFVSYSDTRSTTPENTNTSRIKKITLTPKYVDAGYAAVPYMFKSSTLTSSERSILSRRNSRTKTDLGALVENLSTSVQNEQDTLLNKYATNFVYIPGSAFNNKHAESSWPSSTKHNSQNTDNVIDTMKIGDVVAGNYHFVWQLPYDPYVISNNTLKTLSDIEEYYNLSSKPNGADIPDLLFSETYLTRHFVLELFRCYYNHLFGLKGTQNELKDSDFTTVNKEAFDKLRDMNWRLSQYVNATNKSTEYDNLKIKYPNIIYSKDELPGHVFVVGPNILLCNDLSVAKNLSQQGLQYYWQKDFGICSVRVEDAMTICNLMTYLYNLENNANLSYAYIYKTEAGENLAYSGHAVDGMSNPPVIDDLDGTNYRVLTTADFSFDSYADGFRLPSHQELEYVTKVITNEMTVGVEGANLESGFHNKWTYNKQQTGVDPTNIQHYFKTGLSATCEGLRLIPTLPLEDNGEPRNRENASEYLSYRIGKNTEYNFLTDVAKMKSNLNFRNGANLFDIDGYLNIFTHDVFKKDDLYYVLMRFNNAQVANEDYKVPPTLSSFIDDFYFKYTRVFGWADSFRVCRQINN